MTWCRVVCLQGPEVEEGGYADGDDEQFEGEAETPVVAETEAAGAEDEGVVLVADGGEEGA